MKITNVLSISDLCVVLISRDMTSMTMIEQKLHQTLASSDSGGDVDGPSLCHMIVSTMSRHSGKAESHRRPRDLQRPLESQVLLALTAIST